MISDDRIEEDPMRVDTLRHWRHMIAHVLLHHMPEQPYPSDHPASLRRAPRDQRG